MGGKKTKSGCFRFSLAMVAVLVIAVPTVASADAWTSQGKNVVTAKLGTYSLKYSYQDELTVLGGWVCFVFVCGYSTGSLPADFQKNSREVAGLEYERLTEKGFSYGADVFHIKNKFNVPSLAPSAGTASTNFLMAKITKYFGESDARPFIAAGVGIAKADLEGSIEKSAQGAAGLLAIGVRYQPKRVGFVAEYRYVYAPEIELENEDERPGVVGGSIDLSGRGFFLGVSVRI